MYDTVYPMKKKFLDFWSSSKPPSRLWGLGCAVVAILVSFLISLHLQNTARIDQYRVAQIESMQDSMIQFQIFASAFASEMNEAGNVSAATRGKLVENLNDQFGRIRIVQQSVPNIDSLALEAYQQKVSNMIKAVNGAHDNSDMRDFWTAASDLLYARNTLNRNLKKAV